MLHFTMKFNIVTKQTHLRTRRYGIYEETKIRCHSNTESHNHIKTNDILNSTKLLTIQTLIS